MPLAAPEGAVERLEPILAADEIARAVRFHFDTHRRCYIRTRAAIRVLLAERLSIDPRDVVFKYGARGKPALDLPETSIEFNVSHSGDMAVFALTSGCLAGIDVEHIRPMESMQQIASRFFCREEAEELSATPREQQTSAFFRCWTRKEAYIKAVGEGLHAPLDRFRVSFKADLPARFIHIDGSAEQAAGWNLHDIGGIPGYAIALAYDGPARPVSVSPFRHT